MILWAPSSLPPPLPPSYRTYAKLLSKTVLFRTAVKISYRKLPLIKHGLIQLGKDFTGAYKRGAYIRGELKTRLKKKRFNITYIAVLTKILFEWTRFFKLQNVVKNRIYFNTGQRGDYTRGAYSPVYWAYNWGAYKWGVAYKR